MAYMDYMDLAVCCPRNAIKLNHSLIYACMSSFSCCLCCHTNRLQKSRSNIHCTIHGAGQRIWVRAEIVWARAGFRNSGCRNSAPGFRKPVSKGTQSSCNCFEAFANQSSSFHLSFSMLTEGMTLFSMRIKKLLYHQHNSICILHRYAVLCSSCTAMIALLQRNAKCHNYRYYSQKQCIKFWWITPMKFMLPCLVLLQTPDLCAPINLYINAAVFFHLIKIVINGFVANMQLICFHMILIQGWWYLVLLILNYVS